MAYVCIGLGDLDAAQRCILRASGNRSRKLIQLGDLLQARVWQESGRLDQAEDLLRTLKKATSVSNMAQQGLDSCARDKLWLECWPIHMQRLHLGESALLDCRTSEPVVFLSSLLLSRDLLSLRRLLSSADWEAARVGNSCRARQKVRRSKVTWLQDPRHPRALWHRLFTTAQAVNRRCFGLPLIGSEALQVASYAPAPSAFEWHADRFADGRLRARSLTMVMALNDTSDYEGGALEFRARTGKVRSHRLDAGQAVFFSSDLQHRVSPVTAGERMSLTAWFQRSSWPETSEPQK